MIMKRRIKKSHMVVLLLVCLIAIGSIAVLLLKDRTPYRDVNTCEDITFYQSKPHIPIILQNSEYTFVNSGNDSYVFNTWFRVEVRKFGVWRTIPCEAWATMDVAMIIPPHGERTYVPNLEDMYGELPGGTYRIVVRVRNESTGQHHFVAAEFEI